MKLMTFKRAEEILDGYEETPIVRAAKDELHEGCARSQEHLSILGCDVPEYDPEFLHAGLFYALDGVDFKEPLETWDWKVSL